MAKEKRSKTLDTVGETLAPDLGFRSVSCEGDRLEALLSKLQRSLELAKVSKGEIPDKIWMKLQFAIGINDVTRVLERMPLPDSNSNLKQDNKHIKSNYKFPSVPLQAVILAADCNPKWLTKHVPQIAASRNVTIISLKDKKTSSFRLGQLVKVKTALAVGIKDRGSIINKVVEEFLSLDSSLVTK